MPRTDDTFYRVLWVTLVAVALTFTVILTSVFVDIDGLLVGRGKPPAIPHPILDVNTELVPSADELQSLGDDEEDDEMDSSYRTKRSLESENFLLHIKSPKMKAILTNRLAALLEKLDEQEPHATNAEELDLDINVKNIIPNSLNQVDMQKEAKETGIFDEKNKLINKNDSKDILHSAMHSIILQGIVKHMDLNEVYRKVHLLMKSFNTQVYKDFKENEVHTKTKPAELSEIESKGSFSNENKLLDELTKCKQLQEQIEQNKDFKNLTKNSLLSNPQIEIKTTIDIRNDQMGNENLKNSPHNITAHIKLMYNGKEIKTLDMNDSKTEENVLNRATENIHLNSKNNQTVSHVGNLSSENVDTVQIHLKKSVLDQAIVDYLKTNNFKSGYNQNLIPKDNMSKRLKRQIKVRYTDVPTKKTKQKDKLKHNDDELYVEIETHFDGKGTAGDKKKKLVRTLIDKIQKAINTNFEDVEKEKTVLQKQGKIRKRLQSPIDYKDKIPLSSIVKDKPIEHRQLHPIGKTVKTMQPLKSVLDKIGDTWKKVYNGPGFLTVSKSLNSAEMRELDIDYNSVMDNGIPKRLIKPINTDDEDGIKPNEAEMGNVTLVLKDINGSGFSIGINQYTDEPPDQESLNMYTGIEHLIKAYHDHYDQSDIVSNESTNIKNYELMSDQEMISGQLNGQREATDLNKENEEITSHVFTSNNRKKRKAVSAKLFSNIKSKTKLNKFLNTNAMATKKIFRKIKRNKRQINKIRIVATDHDSRNSKENNFYVSRENILADRAIVRDMPEVEIADNDEQNYDYVQSYVNPYNVDTPNLQPAYFTNVYNTKSLHSELMSKYPHVFVENVSSAKDYVNIKPSNYDQSEMSEIQKYRNMGIQSSRAGDNEKNNSSTSVDDIVNAIIPPKNNYRLRIKILPKNRTDKGPGYKEIHTLINKSYDTNGLRYISSVNVSEIAKYESLNNSKESKETEPEVNRIQNQIKYLLELHKRGIDQQVEHLRMESQKLNHMIGKGSSDNYIANVGQLKEIFELLGLKHSPESENNNTVYNTTNTATTTPTVTLTNVTKLNLKSRIDRQQDESERINIISAIKQNENTTREILQKIDKNTDILQLLLQRFTDKIESLPQMEVKAERVLRTNSPKYLIGNQAIVPFLDQIQTNNTDSIPFVYAFQHPIEYNSNKPLKTMANVVYHGHIHANNGIKNDDIKGNSQKDITKDLKPETHQDFNIKREKNDTKFFIDDLENDFKIVSNLNNRIPLLNEIKTNVTKV